ncbi:MAG TPA: hypothetical protein V6C58_25870, partial [Allocoleopsis sp.]
TRIKSHLGSSWGKFISGDCNPNKIDPLKANELGLLFGDYIEMAVCWIGNKVLTFEPNYIQEPFTEIWGFPVSGKFKDRFAKNASQLTTFLLHRQSRDNMMKTIEEFSKDAFNSWTEEGMPGDAEEYTQNKLAEYYFSKIFRFEIKETSSKVHGKYFYVETTSRNPESELDKAALKVAQQIYGLQVSNQNSNNAPCRDKLIEENHHKNVLLLGGSETTFLLSEDTSDNGTINVETNGTTTKKKAKTVV